MASWWCAIHGYRHPALDAAVTAQLRADGARDVRRAHARARGALAERLTELAPDGLERVFFADSGSVSVEVAIKMCAAVPARARAPVAHAPADGARRLPRRHRRGDGGLRPGRRDAQLFAGVLPQHVFAERPPDGFGAGSTRTGRRRCASWRARHADELAGVIVEPVVQGAGGMRFHSPACVALMREVCDEHGLLLVLDEIATGFGRTGAMFACEHAGVVPGRDVRRQGAHRRLHDARGRALHARASRRPSPAARGAA